MNVNEGSLDRTIRTLAGILLIGATLFGYIGAWGWIGVVPLLTGTLGMCPLYSLLGFNTTDRP
jgi:hypothetical protein